MQKKVAPKLLKIITVSKNSKKDIQTDFKCLSKDISVIDNGIDTEIFFESSINHSLMIGYQ